MICRIKASVNCFVSIIIFVNKFGVLYVKSVQRLNQCLTQVTTEM